MKNLLIVLSIFCFTLLIVSCENEVPEEVIEEVIQKTFVDDASAEETAADTSSTGVYQEEVIEKETSLQEALKTNKKPEVEEGAMSFCDCVKRNKELSNIMMSDDATDAEFDKAMEELETMKIGDCKIMFPDQSNIEEKQAHERKVMRCLGK